MTLYPSGKLTARTTSLQQSANPKTCLETSELFAPLKKKVYDVSLSSPFPLFTDSRREQRAKRAAWERNDAECPEKRRGLFPDEKRKCPETFCHHLSYRCSIECPGQDTGAVACEQYNCNGTYHCSSEYTIPMEEVCNNITQCPGSDNEFNCARPCRPSCMCIGLTVNYIHTSNFHLKKTTSKNDLQSGKFLRLPNISYLSIEDIHTIPERFIGGLYHLKFLNVSNNKITVLADNVFNGLSSLTELRISNNQIEVVPEDAFNGLSTLTELYLNKNQIGGIPGNVFSKLSALTKLYLNKNQIESLPDNVFSQLSSLTNLDLSENKIQVLPSILFKELSVLKYLNLSKNQIDFLPENIFRGLSALTVLDLNGNKIRVLPEQVLMGLSSLAFLRLHENSIVNLTDDIFASSSGLRILNLRGNQISELPEKIFHSLSSLKTLMLSDNQIKFLPDNVFQGLSLLKKLWMSKNQIKFLPVTVFQGLSSLKTLWIIKNAIKFLPEDVFQGLSSLKTLTINSNQITVLPKNVFHGLSSIKKLWISDNQLAALPDNVFQGLPLLSDLRISRNQLIVLPDNVVRGLSHLRVLMLAKNNLFAIPVLPFSTEFLDMSFNALTNIPPGSFTNNSNMKMLNIIGNKLHVQKNMFEGLNNLRVLMTDTPFMCCVKPKTVADHGCVNHERPLACFQGSISCKTESDAISSCYDLVSSGVLRVFLWMIGVCALIGNAAVLFYRLFMDRTNITKSYSLFVLNLSISDFLMGVYLLIIGIADIHYSGMYAFNDQHWRTSIVCTTAGILSTISSEMSTFLILLVTVDRVIVIAFPMSRLSRSSISWKQAVFVSALFWLVSITIAIIPVIALQSYFKGEYYSQSGVCLALPLTTVKQPGAEYSFAVFVCLNSIIFFVIVLGQICIFKSIVTSGKRMTSSQNRQREMSVARTLLMVVATDFFCWFPIGVMGVVSKSGYQIPDDAYAWTMVFVLPVNAAINPFLYTAIAIWRKRQREKSTVDTTTSEKRVQGSSDKGECTSV